MAKLRVVFPVIPAVTHWRLLIDGEEFVLSRWIDVCAGEHDVEVHVTAVASSVIAAGVCRWVVTILDSSDVEISVPNWLEYQMPTAQKIRSSVAV